MAAAGMAEGGWWLLWRDTPTLPSNLQGHVPPEERWKERVSSVLNREAKQFGKKHMFDGNEETCWNSDQGSTQWLTLEFPHTVKISQIQIQFQGGFASRKCRLHGCSKGEELSQITEVYPEDINSLQSFFFSEEVLDKLKITFEDSTDFFGRIVIYHLDVLGEKL